MNATQWFDSLSDQSLNFSFERASLPKPSHRATFPLARPGQAPPARSPAPGAVSSGAVTRLTRLAQGRYRRGLVFNCLPVYSVILGQIAKWKGLRLCRG